MIRLGLTLNYSVFLYEVFLGIRRGVYMARTAFEATIAEPENAAEDSDEDSTLTTPLRRDNLSPEDSGSMEPPAIDPDGRRQA